MIVRADHKNWPGFPSRSVLIMLCLGGVGAGAAITASWWAPGWSGRSRDRAQLVPVTSTVMVVSTKANGLVVALKKVNVSPVTPGRISQLYIKEGSRVSSGQLIARMKNEEIVSAVRQLEAQLNGARAEYRATANRTSRNENLLREGAVALDFQDQLRAQELKAKATVTDLEEKLRNAQNQLRDTYIYAPFPGIITRRYAEAGEYVAPATSASATAGATSTSIAELSKGLEVRGRISEADLLTIHPDQKVRIETDAYPDEVFTGQVRSVSPRAESLDNVISFPVSITLSSGLNKLKPEMNVKLTFMTRPIRDALTIPLAALVTRRDGVVGAFTQTEAGGSAFVPLKIGVVSNDQAQILEGLKKGQKVYLSAPDSATP